MRRSSLACLFAATLAVGPHVPAPARAPVPERLLQKMKEDPYPECPEIREYYRLGKDRLASALPPHVRTSHEIAMSRGGQVIIALTAFEGGNKAGFLTDDTILPDLTAYEIVSWEGRWDAASPPPPIAPPLPETSVFEFREHGFLWCQMKESDLRLAALRPSAIIRLRAKGPGGDFVPKDGYHYFTFQSGRLTCFACSMETPWRDR
jgi:hypothetical protein